METGLGMEAEAETEALTARLKTRLDTGSLDLHSYSPLTLAYIGDAVFDLLIRTMIVAAGNTNNRTLHQRTVRYVKAEAQAKMMARLLPLLTEEEEGVYRRGRNAKMATRTRSASLGDYKKSTGFEALFGYLYLRGEKERMLALAAVGISAIEKQPAAGGAKGNEKEDHGGRTENCGDKNRRTQCGARGVSGGTHGG